MLLCICSKGVTRVDNVTVVPHLAVCIGSDLCCVPMLRWTCVTLPAAPDLYAGCGHWGLWYTLHAARSALARFA